MVQAGSERGEWFCARVAARELSRAGEVERALGVLEPFIEAGWNRACWERAEVLLEAGRVQQALDSVRPDESAVSAASLGMRSWHGSDQGEPFGVRRREAGSCFRRDPRRRAARRRNRYPRLLHPGRGRHPDLRRRTALALRPDGSIRADSMSKETRTSGGRTSTLEEAITTDFALVRAARGDRYGNLVFHRSVTDFNPLAAMTGRFTVAEVEEPDRARRPRRRRRCHHAPVHRRHRHRSRCLRATTGRPEVAPRRGVVVSGQSAGVRATSALPERDGRPSGGVSV